MAGSRHRSKLKGTARTSIPRRALDIFAFCSPILVLCSTLLPPTFIRSSSFARGVIKTSRHRLRRCRTHGLSRSAHFVASRDDICQPTSFRDAFRTTSWPKLVRREARDGRNEAGSRPRRAGTTESGSLCEYRCDRGGHHCGCAAGSGRHQFVVPTNLCCSLGQCQLGAKDPTASDRGMSAPGR